MTISEFLVYSFFWSSACNRVCIPEFGFKACIIAQLSWILSSALVYYGIYTDVPDKAGLQENIIAAGVDFDKLRKYECKNKGVIA